MNAKLEQWYPLLIGFIISATHFFALRYYNLPIESSNEVKDLFSAIIGLSGITIGFLATTQSILLSIGNHRIIKILKSGDGKKYRRLINFLMDAIKWSFSLVILSIIGLILNPSYQALWHSFYFSIWILVGITTGCSYYRIINIFGKILRSPD